MTEEELLELFYALPIGIALTTSKGDILSSNPYLNNILLQLIQGIDEYSNITQILKTYDSKLTDLIEESDRKNTKLVIENYDISTTHDRIKCLRIKITKMISKDLLFIIEDFSERKKLEESLKASNLMKDRLFSIIGHDLRGPIGSITSALNLITSNVLDQEKTKKLLDLTEKTSRSVFVTLENLLHWSISWNEDFQQNPQIFPLGNIVNRKIDLLELIARGKNLKIENNVSEDILIFGDSEMVEITISNLLHNAIKFSKNGESIKISANDLGEEIKITISDTGIGIPENKILNIFDSYRINSMIGTSGEKGTGLGLSLCKKLVELNKGRIEVTSKENIGTDFFIYFPKAYSK